MSFLAEVRSRALRSLVPPPRLRLSDWIEREIVLPEGVSALPGHVRLWPYQREIADVISNPMIERVTLVKGVRLGFTTLVTGAIAAYVANEPAPILALLPTDGDCRDYVVSELEPIFAATPALAGALASDTLMCAIEKDALVPRIIVSPRIHEPTVASISQRHGELRMFRDVTDPCREGLGAMGSTMGRRENSRK